MRRVTAPARKIRTADLSQHLPLAQLLPKSAGLRGAAAARSPKHCGGSSIPSLTRLHAPAAAVLLSLNGVKEKPPEACSKLQ